MSSRRTESVTVGDQEIRISNPGKILFPESGITKRDFVEYYRRIAPYILSHIRNRPLSMQRFPDGIGGEFFFQKELPEYFPDFFERVDVKPDEDEEKLYGTVTNEASVVYLANLVTIPHIWMSCVEHLRRPDRLVWDLDPSGLGFKEVKTAAKLLRYLLGELGLESYPMVTGSRGIHVVVFIEPEHDVSDVFEFAKGVAQLITRKLPQLFTVEYSKSKRGRKIYIDVHRNAYEQTAVAPYAVRAIEGAPVALPVRWEDVEDAGLEATSFTMYTAPERIESEGEPWTGDEGKQALGPAQERLAELLGAKRTA